MRIQVMLDGALVTEVAFTVRGCTTALACANAAAALARGRTVAQILREVDCRSVIDVLDGLPDDHTFLAQQATDTLHGAVRDALLNASDGWKKIYRT
jgi:NifU-like protein involved in Fe-S cluster formation